MQIGFMGALTLLLIALALLLGVIAWSWWWVTLPLWSGLALILSVFVLIQAVSFTLQLVKSLTKTASK